MILPETPPLPRMVSRQNDRLASSAIASSAGLRLRVRTLWVCARGWAQRWVNLREMRREPSPKALVRAVRGAWPLYRDHLMTRPLIRGDRILRLPAQPRTGGSPARVVRIR